VCHIFSLRQNYLSVQSKINKTPALTNQEKHPILKNMKVTAVIADDLVNNVKAYTRSSTVTEAITIALKDWLDMHNIKELNKQIAQNPLCIDNGRQIREINRTV
jgi:predicted methyltransferase MtxX (methanogen marker protein 4)